MKHIKVGQTVYYNEGASYSKLVPLKVTMFGVSFDQKYIWVYGTTECGCTTAITYDSIVTTSKLRYWLNKLWWN